MQAVVCCAVMWPSCPAGHGLGGVAGWHGAADRGGHHAMMDPLGRALLIQRGRWRTNEHWLKKGKSRCCRQFPQPVDAQRLCTCMLVLRPLPVSLYRWTAVHV
jgi:hypothetical protein